MGASDIHIIWPQAEFVFGHLRADRGSPLKNPHREMIFGSTIQIKLR